jgi:hypothetical protein
MWEDAAGHSKYPHSLLGVSAANVWPLHSVPSEYQSCEVEAEPTFP